MSDFAQEMGEILQTFNHSFVTAVDEAAVEVGKMAAKELKTKNHGAKTWKNYPKGWTIKKEKNGKVYVWNAKHYQLTHLLEKGHKTNYKSGVFGKRQQTRAFPHIEEVETMVQEKFPEEIARRIKMQN